MIVNQDMLNFKITEQEASLLSKLTARICYLKVISSGVDVSKGFCVDFMLVFNAFECKKTSNLYGDKTISKWERGKHLSAETPNCCYFIFFLPHSK